MNKPEMKMRKWRDENGNTYTVEKAVRNGRWIVVRTNEGGNRHGSKQFCAAGNAAVVQRLLDETAVKSGWAEVME